MISGRGAGSLAAIPARAGQAEDRDMQDSLWIAIVTAAIVFGLMIIIPIASFLLKAAVVALIAGAAVYVLMRLFGRP